MSLRKDEMSTTKMLLATGGIVLNLVQGGAELRVDVLDLDMAAAKQERNIVKPAIDIRAEAQAMAKEAQAMAKYESTEMVTLTHGAVWGASHPAPEVNVLLENMEEEKKLWEGVADGLAGADEQVEKLLESMDEEPAKDEVVEPIIDPKDRNNQVEDPKLAELQEVQKQERDSAEYLMGERRGKLDEAFTSLREAVRRDLALRYDEPWGWMEPPAHALGALLVQAGRVEEAEKVYREDLQRHPENGWALHGLAECLRRQGKAEEAGKVEERFKAAWARADVQIPGSCFCRTKA